MTLTKEDRQEIAEMIAGAISESCHKESRPSELDMGSWEANAIRSSKLTNLIVAPEDYYEIREDGTKKTFFTWGEALEIEKKMNGKWRLPTRGEWTVLCEEFAMGENGVFSSKKLQEAFGLHLTGWMNEDGDIHDTGKEGNYWSSSITYNRYFAYSLSLHSSAVSPQEYSCPSDGFAVRLVTEKGEK